MARGLRLSAPGAAWVVLAGALAAAAVLAWWAPAPALDWQPARAAAEPWRTFSAAFVHWGAPHLGANLAGAVVVAAFGWAARLPPRATLAWAAAWPLTHLGLLPWPALAHYGGLSGVLHAGVAVGAAWLVARDRGWRRGIGALVAAGLGLKLLLEQPWGPLLRAQAGWDVAVVPLAHVSGTVAGLLCAAVALAWGRAHDLAKLRLTLCIHRTRSPKPMITLCGITLSNYYNKVKMVLLEKGIPFTEERVATGSKDEAVLAATPLGKVPFIRVDGRTLCESQVIADYLEAVHPQPPLVPADPLAAAKVRELCTFVELHLELVARELYGQAFFGGTASDATKERVRKQLTKNIAGFKRLARFSPYLAGDSFTLADCAGWVSLPLVGMATKSVLGEDLLAAAGVDWKAYAKLIGERPSAQRVTADRKADQAPKA